MKKTGMVSGKYLSAPKSMLGEKKTKNNHLSEVMTTWEI